VPHKGEGGPVQPSWRNDLGWESVPAPWLRLDLISGIPLTGFSKSCLQWCLTHLVCDANILTSKCAEKNHRQRNKCITVGSIEEPLLIESTMLLLSHLNSTLIPESHTMQFNTIGTSSFAMMSLWIHSLDQFSLSHWLPKTAPHPQRPEVSVKILWEGEKAVEHAPSIPVCDE